MMRVVYLFAANIGFLSVNTNADAQSRWIDIYEGGAKVDWNDSQTSITPTAFIPDLFVPGNNWKGKLSTNAGDSSQNPCSTFILPGESVDTKIQFDLRLTAPDTGEVIEIRQQEVTFPPAYTKWQCGLQFQYYIKISNPFSADGASFYSVSVSPLETGESNMTR